MKKKPNLKTGKPFAKKSLGQNFLTDQNFIARIVAELEIEPGETIVEIGPGRGALTEHLVASGANVVAVELDRNLVPFLRDKFRDDSNFRVFELDALHVDFEKLLISTEAVGDSKRVKLIANLPYYISTAILQKLIEQRKSFSKLILMLQREVVDRISAREGSSERGFLSVIIQAYAAVEKLFDVPPEAFRPIPKVWSSIVSLEIPAEVDTPFDEVLFRELVSAGFRQKRKTLLNNLKNSEEFNYKVGETLESANVLPDSRAENLTIEEWIRLTNEYHRTRKKL